MELLRHRLKSERKRMKLTQGQLAAMVDKSMGQSFISNLETGEREETPFIAQNKHKRVDMNKHVCDNRPIATKHKKGNRDGLRQQNPATRQAKAPIG